MSPNKEPYGSMNCKICLITKHMFFQRELKQKEEEMRKARNRSAISEEDEEVLMKRISMTEDAHKTARGKSNALEDVSATG